MGEDDTETVAAHAPDDVTHAQPAVEPAPDLDDDLVGGLVAEHLVDAGELVDPYREIGAGKPGAHALHEHVIERLAQPLLVEMAGEFVVIGQVLEPLLLRFAHGDVAQHAEHSLRPPDRVEFGRAALAEPGEGAVADPDAVLDIERGAPGIMGLQPLLTHDEIVGMNALGKTAAARRGRTRR